MSEVQARGKTTICKAIMGLLGSAYQAAGQIIFQGTDLLALHKKDRKQIYGKEICFIMQNPMTAFNPSIRVGKQLEKTYRLHHDHSSRTEMHILFNKTLRRLGLEGHRQDFEKLSFRPFRRHAAAVDDNCCPYQRTSDFNCG